MNAIRELAADAYVWGSALVGAARLRHNVTRPDDPCARRPPSSAAAPMNRLGHQSALSDPELGVGVAPNVDTLYSLAWIDTDQEPFVLETPDFGDRYYSFQIASADTENALCPGQRTHGSRLPPLFLHRTEYRGQVPDGMIPVPSRTRYAMIAGRVLVQPEDPDDVERVRALQARMRLRTLARWNAGDDDANPISAQAPLPTADEVSDPALLFLHQLGVVLGERVTADDERALVESLAPLGIGPDGGFDPDSIAPGDRDMVVAGLQDGRERVDDKIDHLGHRANGWSVNLAGSNFGGDHLLRAAVAQNQIYVVPAEEAIYPVSRVDANGDRLDGSRRYQLRLPAPPPAGAFWSLTAYGTPGPLVANALGRYAIGDRSPGLEWGADGSLTIALQHRRPESGPDNWLPVPTGPFHLMMRLYWPGPTVLDGSWDPPPVEPIDIPHTRSTAPQTRPHRRSDMTIETAPPGTDGSAPGSTATLLPSVSGLRTYDLHAVDQLCIVPDDDLIPNDTEARRSYLRMLATDATIYGLPSVYEYSQLYGQAVDTTGAGYTGFNRFQHERELATPQFTAFKTPNVDTLYSNAWLDLRAGPALLEIPPIPDRYYTLQFVDMYGNASNLSSRTVGGSGGRFTVATTTWSGEVPAGTHLFRVATPFMWILMRILVRGTDRDLEVVRSLQDRVTIDPRADAPPIDFVTVTFDAVQEEWEPFFRALDWTLRYNGHPAQEDALVQRFRALGLGTPEPFDPELLAPVTKTALDDGFQDAMRIISRSAGQVGVRVPTGWNTGTAGENGYAHLRRAVQNFVGTGGNVTAEKKFFVAFEDGDGVSLDGAGSSYSMTFPTPLPVDGHWSLTVYPLATGLLYPNELDRYAIGATSNSLVLDGEGALTIRLQHDRPEQTSNWLPVPAEEFYVDLRLWQPRAEARDGRWLPPPIERAPRRTPPTADAGRDRRRG